MMDIMVQINGNVNNVQINVYYALATYHVKSVKLDTFSIILIV